MAPDRSAGPAPPGFAATELGRTFREESGRAVAAMIRVFGDVDLAEDGVQEAFAIAATRWPADGVPPNPGGWIVTTARRRIIDRLRRESSRDDKQAQAARFHGTVDASTDDPADAAAAASHEEEVVQVRDDQLRLIFLCCHPALGRDAQVALTLRLVVGLQTPEIARAFLVPEPTMAQRLVRAKRKIRAANIPFRVPTEAELVDRLRPVLDVVYLLANEAHTASLGDDLTRPDLAHEAIRLARLLAQLMPDEPEVLGLLALLLLAESRRPTRTAPDGSLVRLADQDRSRWDRALVAEGQDLVRRCLRRNQPGPFQIQAAVAAVHSDAPTAADTDWRQVLALYDRLLAHAPTAVVALNRVVALAEVEGPEAALGEVDRLADALASYHLLHATRADLLERAGRHTEARPAWARAIALATNATERAYLESRRSRSPCRE